MVYIGFRDLIHENNLTSTHSSFYTINYLAEFCRAAFRVIQGYAIQRSIQITLFYFILFSNV